MKKNKKRMNQKKKNKNKNKKTRMDDKESSSYAPTVLKRVVSWRCGSVSGGGRGCGGSSGENG